MDNRISKEELIDIVKRLINCEYESEEVEGAMIDLLEKNTCCPEIADYIYWSKEDQTPEQIIEKALRYKPMIL